MHAFNFIPIQLMARHKEELDDLRESLESDRSRQMLLLRDSLAESRRRRMEDLRRSQDAELTNEMLEQKKELDEIRLQQVNTVFYLNDFPVFVLVFVKDM